MCKSSNMVYITEIASPRGCDSVGGKTKYSERHSEHSATVQLRWETPNVDDTYQRQCHRRAQERYATHRNPYTRRSPDVKVNHHLVQRHSAPDARITATRSSDEWERSSGSDSETAAYDVANTLVSLAQRPRPSPHTSVDSLVLSDSGFDGSDGQQRRRSPDSHPRDRYSTSTSVVAHERPEATLNREFYRPLLAYDNTVRRASIPGPVGHQVTYERGQMFRPGFEREVSLDRGSVYRRSAPYTPPSSSKSMCKPQSELIVTREMSITDSLECRLASATKSGTSMFGSVPVSHRQLFARAFDGLF